MLLTLKCPCPLLLEWGTIVSALSLSLGQEGQEGPEGKFHLGSMGAHDRVAEKVLKQSMKTRARPAPEISVLSQAH